MKKAIIIASFGCSILDSREKYIETIESAIKNNYKNIDCFRVFTSEIIRKKMKREENIEIDNMDSCLKKLKANGYTHVYVAATHIIPGFEYDKILKAANEYQNDFEEIRISRTLLDNKMGDKEKSAVKSYIKTDLKNDEAVVLVGHGTEHISHKYYKQFEELLKKDVNNSFIINIEGNTYKYEVIKELKERSINKIYLYPFLIVAGDHALNDITSNEDDSIKSYFIKNGFRVEAFINGLGANDLIKDLFVDRLRDVYN